MTTGDWYFAHPSEWEDPFESHLTNAQSAHMFAQCWCRNPVSDAMWRIYSKDYLGVRIAVVESKLLRGLDEATELSGCRYRFGRVKYVSETAYPHEVNKIAASLTARASRNRASQHLFLKRSPFSHEAESRIVLFDKRRPDSSGRRGRFLRMNAMTLIESIYMDPRAPTELATALGLMFRHKLKFQGRIAQSSLYTQGQPITIR